MANPASTSSPFSIPLPHALQDDDVVLDRLSAASQSKIYPSKCSRTEIPLRRILLVTRLWNEVRHYQTMRSSFASQQRYDMDFGHGDWNPPSPPPAPQQAQQQAQQSKSAEVPVVLDDEFALSLLPADLVEVDMGHVGDWDEEIEDESSSSEEEEANARKRRDSSHEEDKDRRASKRRKDQSVPPFEADDSTTPTSAGPILSDSLSAATSPVIAPA